MYSVELAETWCAAVSVYKYVCVCVCVVELVAKDSNPQYFPLQSCCFISFIEREREGVWGSVRFR